MFWLRRAIHRHAIPQNKPNAVKTQPLQRPQLRIEERTGGATDVVEGQLSDAGVELEEEGEGLADTAGGTEDGDLGKLFCAC